MVSRFRSTALLGAVLLACCSPSQAPGPSNHSGPPGSAPVQPSLSPALSPKSVEKYEALKLKVQAAQAVEAPGLLAARKVQHLPQLSYDPKQAAGLNLIQQSPLALSGGELAKLGEHGFVISTRQQFPTFLRGYAAIYQNHLPIYVSADPLLEALHRSYDQVLMKVEDGALVPKLAAMLGGMRTKLSATTLPATPAKDVDLYLAVALGLLNGQTVAPVAGADAAKIAAITESVKSATNSTSFELFGVERLTDLSQFKPRGHYTATPELQQYFHAMMWLGRVDLRLLETQRNGEQVFRRRSYDAMLAINDLMEGSTRANWDHIAKAIDVFVGKSDSMRVPEVAQLVTDLGGSAAASSASDPKIRAAIVAGGYGEQQIANDFQENAIDQPLPLNRSFALFGQAYVVDSDVFSRVVYARVRNRWMPNPLDAAFAALGNDQAVALLAPELATAGYPGALNTARTLIDSHDAAFWDSSFYNLWLKAIRALSPTPDMSQVTTKGMPEVAGTEAWGRRILNTQLGSWAELRHDTLLYAKQSYTDIPACAFPDAYVEPYPEFFAALQTYAEHSAPLVDVARTVSPDFAASVASYFENLRNAATVLRGMAENQRLGTAFTAEQMAFINQAVVVEQESAVCVTIEVPNGWYSKLFFDPATSIVLDPTIADVHTQPADAAGNPVGNVLHVATAYPRLMVTTVDTCNGPRTYAGMAFSYHEQITTNFVRKTDDEWSQEIMTTPPQEVPWVRDLLGQ
mgnify:CR=1 FL=1